MKFTLKAAIAGAVTAAFAGGGLVALAGSAFAAQTAPPWEPDGTTSPLAGDAPPYGNIVFYDANGVAVTSGTDLNSPFAYAVATTAADTGATKAIVNFYDPQHGVPTATWGGTAETGTTTFSPASALPAGTPADLVAGAPTNPVAATSTADITTWLGSNTPDTTAGYANTIEVRLTDSGASGHGNAAGTYWESDIGYNTTAAPITVDGTTVPANGWAQLFPFSTAPSPAETIATSATGGTLTTGSPITLTATGPTTPAGTVVFEDNGTPIAGGPSPYVTPTGGTATYTYTPAAGSHSYTASFVPTLGAESSAGTATASQVMASTSGGAAVVVSAPTIATSTALSDSAASIAYGGSETLTATVTGSDGLAAGVAGNVQFQVGGSNFGSPVPTTVAGTTGTAVDTTTTLPAGTDSVTAVFTPTDTAYGSSTSPAVVITVAAPAACSLTGSVCSDQQNIQVTVNPGTITISTPYTSSNPFVLPAMTLSSDGTYLQSSATFPSATLPGSQQIVVTSDLAPAYAWTLSVAATPLTSTAGTIPADGLGLTAGALLNNSGAGAYGGTVTFTNIPALNPSPTDGPGTGPGLSGTPQTWALSSASDGTAELDGTLSLDASTGTPAGTYNGTITFSVS